MGKSAWRVRRGGLLVGGRGLVETVEVVVVVAFGRGLGRLVRRDERKALGVGRGGGCSSDCGSDIGWGRRWRVAGNGEF